MPADRPRPAPGRQWSPVRPADLPADITERLSRELTRALAAPALKERFNSLGAEPAPVPQPGFRKLLAEEDKTLSTLIKDRNIVVE